MARAHRNRPRRRLRRARKPRKTWRLTRDRNELWREDLRELSTELQKRHKNPFFAITKENWEKSVAELDARVPQLSDVEMMTAFMRLVASIGDGHTALQVRSLKPGMRNYPIAFVWLADGLFVAAAPADHRELIGGKVTKVGELDVDAALAKVGSALPLPNEASRRNFVPTYLALAEVLQGWSHPRRGAPPQSRCAAIFPPAAVPPAVIPRRSRRPSNRSRRGSG